MHWLLWVFIAIFVIAVIIAVVLAVPLLPLPKFEPNAEAAQRYHEISEYGREVIIPIPARNQSPAFALHAVEMGSPAASAPLMVFIHGFPETGVTCWSRQLKYFSNLGYRVVAHDQRGFGKNQDDLSRCNHIEGVEDIAAIIRYYRKDNAVVVGHDWGGLVAWLHALRYPQQCRALITVNMPHPLVFKNALFTSLNQFKKSWYMAAFQIPMLPEWGLRIHNFLFTLHNLTGSGLAKEDIDRYMVTWPSTMTSMLSWYRSQWGIYQIEARGPTAEEQAGYVRSPVLMLFGQDDHFIDHRLIDISLRMYCKHRSSTAQMFEGMSHFLQHQAPREVNNAMEQWLNTLPPLPSSPAIVPLSPLLTSAVNGGAAAIPPLTPLSSVSNNDTNAPTNDNEASSRTIATSKTPSINGKVNNGVALVAA